MSQISKSEIRERRREIARQSLDIGMDDPYWLHNLAQCTQRQSGAYGDLLDIAERLQEDADLLVMAHGRIENSELTPAEAALTLAESVNFGDYSTHGHLYDQIPIEVDIEP